jgi:hypothetical protein
MKNNNLYKYQIGKERKSFEGNTEGEAYDKAIHFIRKNRKHFFQKPVLLTKIEGLKIIE